MKVLVIDNYDSFTFNLVAQLEHFGADIKVVRNDKITAFEAMEYSHILLSPGPGIPDEAGNLKDIIRHCSPNSKILGICLGHQAIAEVFGGEIAQLEKVYHGVECEININQKESIFKDFNRKTVARYHSWFVKNLSDELIAIAEDHTQVNMALKHVKYDVYGFQFHPESILTPEGDQLIKNWLNLPSIRKEPIFNIKEFLTNP